MSEAGDANNRAAVQRLPPGQAAVLRLPRGQGKVLCRDAEWPRTRIQVPKAEQVQTNHERRVPRAADAAAEAQRPESAHRPGVCGRLQPRPSQEQVREWGDAAIGRGHSDADERDAVPGGCGE